MAEKAKRDTSPIVFVRHPHSFVPLSGQRIPPPPSWKPPPLPNELDPDSNKSDQNSSKECNINLGKDETNKVIAAAPILTASITSKPTPTFTKASVGDAEEKSLAPMESSKTGNDVEGSTQTHDSAYSSSIFEKEGDLQKEANLEERQF